MDNISVLLVDDDKLLCNLIYKVLLKTSDIYEIDRVYSSTDALSLIDNKEYDVIVTDILMPDIDGLKLIKIIRENYGNTQIIFITGHGNIDIAIEAIRLGACNFFKKPVDVQLLHLAILQAKEKKDLKDELKESEARFRNAFYNSAAGMCVLTPDGKISLVNSVLCKMIGYTKNELKDKKFIDYIHAEEKGSSIINFMKMVADEINAIKYEGRLVKKDSQVIYSYISASKIPGDNNNPLYFIVQVIDITNIKQLERDLKNAKTETENMNKQLQAATDEAKQMANKALKANAVKDEFVANVSHEIRTPMNGIIGMTHLMLHSPLTHEQRSHVITMRNSAESLLNIINDVLDLSKIEAGKFEIETIQFDIRASIADVVKILSFKAFERGLDLHTIIRSDLPGTVKGDPTRIRQILMNLLGNAIKFTAEGKVVIDVSLKNETDIELEILFSVKDTGIGIPKHRLNKIFQAFSQVDASISRKFGGTGLGLTISKKLSEMMGGEIGVESHEGKGARFWFTVKLEKLENHKSNFSIPEKIKNKYFLIADTDEFARMVIAQYLSFWGIKYCEASNADQIIEIINKKAKSKTPISYSIIDSSLYNDERLVNNLKTNINFNETKILIVVPSLKKEAFNKSKEGIIIPELSKPVIYTDLFRSLLGIADNKILNEQIVFKKNIVPKKQKSRKVLIVEDNIVNQEVAAGILSNNGHSFSVANNGKEAWELLKKDSFDIVFMDVQMPVMDGIEATKIIRDPDSKVINPFIPIIAMTACVMPKDREKCLKCGMNDYIVKPINPEEFLSVLTQYSSGDQQKKLLMQKNIIASQESKELLTFDTHDLMARVADDTNIAVKVLKTYLKTLPNYVKELNQPVEDKNFEQIRFTAHYIKSSSGNIGAKKLSDIALQIELDGNKEVFDNIPENYIRLKLEFEKLIIEIKAFIESQ